MKNDVEDDKKLLELIGFRREKFVVFLLCTIKIFSSGGLLKYRNFHNFHGSSRKSDFRKIIQTAGAASLLFFLELVT